MQFGGEIISVDSALVFRDMDIGTAKPSTAELGAVPHHLINLISPEERYSAARFRSDALAAMHDISARGKLPVLVGGTMLYVKALREGLADLPPADPAARAQIDDEARTLGWPALHAELARRDPHTAARLAPNDSQRIQRALEVVRTTGRPFSEWLAAQARDSELPFNLLPLAILPLAEGGRSVLHQRIAQRFDAMLAAGLVDEVTDLRRRYALSLDLPSMRCVGYRQAWEYLDGQFSAAELRDRGIFATRQLAKRQLTWLRSMPDVRPVDCFSPDHVKQIAVKIEVFLANQPGI